MVLLWLGVAILAASRSAQTTPAGDVSQPRSAEQSEAPRSGSPVASAGAASGVAPAPAGEVGASPSPAAKAQTPPATQLSDGGGVAGTPPPTDAADVRAGWATFYCCTRGYGGAAVVALPGARYVPVGHEPWGWALVSVLRDGKVAAAQAFPVVDACGCGDRSGIPTVVDLSPAAAHELGLETRLGRSPGRWRVIVEVTR
jgi:hypothetical protein